MKNAWRKIGELVLVAAIAAIAECVARELAKRVQKPRPK
jgi:hypothetical protein